MHLAPWGGCFYGIYQAFVDRNHIARSLLITLAAIFVIHSVKIYILLSFLPPAIFWIFLENGKYFRRPLATWIVKPAMLILGLVFAYLAATTVTEGDAKYDLQNIGERTRINAEYLYKISIIQGGSAYYLGELDGSLESMFAAAPQSHYSYPVQTIFYGKWRTLLCCFLH